MGWPLCAPAFDVAPSFRYDPCAQAFLRQNLRSGLVFPTAMLGQCSRLTEVLSREVCDDRRKLTALAPNPPPALWPFVLLFPVLWSTGQFQWLFSIFNFFFVLIIVVPTVLVIGLNLWVSNNQRKKKYVESVREMGQT